MIQLRPVSDLDFEFIHALRAEAYRSYVERHFEVWIEEDQRRYLQQQWPSRIRMLVVLEGEDVGYFGYSRDETTATLGNIILRPSVRGRGVATQVLNDWLIWVDRLGLKASLNVFEDNPAVSLYRRLGFAVESTDPPHLHMVRPARSERLG